MPGIVWPAIPNAKNAATFAVLAQLEMSQWWSPEELEWHQLRQVTALVSFAAKNVPFYRERLAPFASLERPLTMAEWREIPLLYRTDIQDTGDAMAPRRPVKAHGDFHVEKTSGSTGEPIAIRRNTVTDRLHTAFTLRDHVLHKRDFSGKVAVIRRLADKVVESMKAGKVARWVPGFPSGPMVFFDVTDAVGDALKWLLEEEPSYLMTYPTYLRALIQASADAGTKPSGLREIMTFGEVVPDDLRTLCQEAWGATLVDMYSAQEIGVMALECPDHDHYLVQSESVLLEVLDDNQQPCAPGEVGRVFVTPLHNFATPLIRYFIGDYAEVGKPCASGRGLPVVRRFFGRARNMLTLPSGGKIWVALIGCGLEDIKPLRQFQVVQTKDLAIKLKLVVARPLTPEEEAQACAAMINATGHEFDVTLDYVEAIPRSAGGKLEDVVSEVVG